MVEIHSELEAVVHSSIEETPSGGCVIPLDETLVKNGSLSVGDAVRVALIRKPIETPSRNLETTPRHSKSGSKAKQNERKSRSEKSLQVAENDRIVVEISSMGAEGDGVAFLNSGYTIFVPNTSVGDTVLAELTDVHENFAFADLIERQSANENPRTRRSQHTES